MHLRQICPSLSKVSLLLFTATSPDFTRPVLSAKPRTVITVDETQTYQEFYGAGASWTDSSAWLVYGQRQEGDPRALTTEERNEIFNALFSDDGINLRILRQPMGTSDFRVFADYTYQDAQQGVFSVDLDRSYIIPAIQETIRVNPDTLVMGVPWSAPAWMKDSGSLNGGQLLADVYNLYSEYFADYVQSYANEGIPIWAVSIQNEPQHTTPDYPTMEMTSPDHAALAVSVANAFEVRQIQNVKIVIFDHNWNIYDHPMQVLSNADAKAAVDAVSFHCYGGDPSEQTIVRDAHPEKEIFFTECTEYGPVNNFNGDFKWALKNLVIGSVRNWASTVTEWNLVLDGNGGPKLSGGCNNCRGLIDIISWSENPPFVKRPAYYALGHLSKFIYPGARRISSTEPNTSTKTLAMTNVDGSATLIILNDSNSSGKYSVRWFGKICDIDVPGNSAVTLIHPSDITVSFIGFWATYSDQSSLLAYQGEIECSADQGGGGGGGGNGKKGKRVRNV